MPGRRTVVREICMSSAPTQRKPQPTVRGCPEGAHLSDLVPPYSSGSTTSFPNS